MGRLSIVAIMFACMLTAPADAETIGNDNGGYVVTYALRVLKAKQPRIMGRCASACTLYLGHPKACVGPNAVLVFHAPYGSSASGNRYAKEYLMRSYAKTPGLVAWIKARGGLSRRLLTMNGKTAGKYMRRCT